MPDKDVELDQTPVLVQIGVLLKETRENKGLSLEAVQEETKIRRHYLQALEQGKRELLPGDVYLKGFLKNYASFLSLPGEDLVRRYSQSQRQENETPPVRVNYGVPAEQSRFGRILVPAVLLLVLVVVGFWLTKKAKAPDLGPVEPPMAESESQLPFPPDISTPDTEKEQGENLPVENIVETELDTATEIIYKVTADSLQLEIAVISDRCWVALRVDELDEASETIAAGSSRTFSANNKIWLRAGNPRVLDLTINGVHLGVAGPIGQPRNVVFERQPEEE